MSILDMFDKLDDIIYAPIELITEWAKEPLRIWDHKRKEETADRALKREIEQRTAEFKIRSEIQMREKEHEVSQQIKKETEVRRIIEEIEELKKDRQFQRMKAVSEAVMQFQKDLTKLNVSAIAALGEMHLDLKSKAQDMVYEKTQLYKNLQKEAFEDAKKELIQIETEFANNDAAKEILSKAIEMRLQNIITTAHNFLLELNNDIKQLNISISLLSESGQKFIENHLEKFQVIGVSSSNNSIEE